MLNLLKLFSYHKQNNKNSFKGIHLPSMKDQSKLLPLFTLPLPDILIIPIKQHLGNSGKICVNLGDYVLRGQNLTIGKNLKLPVHAPTSGTIDKILKHKTPYINNLDELCIFIKPDGKDLWKPLKKLLNYKQLSRSIVLQQIHNSGIAGMGGAGFPTAQKMYNNSHYKLEILIINATECEPYVTSDELLIQNYVDEIIEGCLIIAWLLKVKKIIIGIEDNKEYAIYILKKKLIYQCSIELRIIPSKYPSGSSKQLVKLLTGMEVPNGKHLCNIGISMQNVSTVLTVKRAIINGEPITERIVTITGPAINQPRNVWVRLGTKVDFILHQITNFISLQNSQVIIGGPLTGENLKYLDVPITKITNCIIVFPIKQIPKEINTFSCIRCGNCADACPINLLPQQLYWYSKNFNQTKLDQYHINNCIECNACAYVCPSYIPLVKLFIKAKQNLKIINHNIKRSEENKKRFENRNIRLNLNRTSYKNMHQHSQNNFLINNINNEIFEKLDTKKDMIKDNDNNINLETILRKNAVKLAISRARLKKSKLKIYNKE